MAGKWVEIPLGDAMTLQRGFDLPSQNRKPGKVPIVSSSGIRDYHSDIAVKGPGVVTGRYGTIGQVFFIKEDYWPLNTTLWVKDFHGNHPLFASYLLRTIDFNSCSDKSGVPGVNRNDLHRIPVLLPPLPTQCAIASVLGSLDDLIELNRETNEILEEMARALFKSWFVDFDPVRAKLEGRPPAGMNAATAALFPDHFQDSELGQIPKGWEVTPLGEAVDVVKGRSYRSDELAPSDTALVTLKSFLRGGGYRADGLKPFTGVYKDIQVVSAGDLIVAFTDVTQAAEVIGKPAIIRGDDQFKKLVASLDVGIVRTKSEFVSIPFLYCLFLTEGFQAHAYAHSSGTTVLHLSKEALPSFLFAEPTKEIALKFREFADQILKLIEENTTESRDLATLRDSLLPKLLNGELTVPAAEELIAASA